MDYRHDDVSPLLVGTSRHGSCGEAGAPAASVVQLPQLDARGYFDLQNIVAVALAHDSSATARSPLPTLNYQTAIPPLFAVHQSTAAILRAARLRDLLAAVEEWRRASGPDRVWWRGEVMWRLQQWRVFHLWPERAAFQAAVARRKRCLDCGVNWADPPSPLCPGCEAYREHQA